MESDVTRSKKECLISQKPNQHKRSFLRHKSAQTNGIVLVIISFYGVPTSRRSGDVTFRAALEMKFMWTDLIKQDKYKFKFKFKFKLSFIVILLHVGTYSGTRETVVMT